MDTDEAKDLRSRIGRISGHAAERAVERLAEAGLPAAPILLLAAQVAEHYTDEDVAVRMVALPRACGDTAGDFYGRESNGDEVWSVVRHGHVINLFLRRSDQPKTKAAFGVDRVALVEGGRVRTFAK